MHVKMRFAAGASCGKSSEKRGKRNEEMLGLFKGRQEAEPCLSSSSRSVTEPVYRVCARAHCSWKNISRSTTKMSIPPPETLTPDPSPILGEGSVDRVEFIFIVMHEACFIMNSCIHSTVHASLFTFRFSLFSLLPSHFHKRRLSPPQFSRSIPYLCEVKFYVLEIMKSILFFCLTLLTIQSALSQERAARLSFGTKPADFNAAQKATDTPARLKQPLDVVYPDTAMKKKLEGIVIVSAFIDANGNVVYGEVEKGSGFRLLDSAALSIVHDGYFIAAQRDGKRVASRMTIPVEFRLNREDWDADKSVEELQEEKQDLEKHKQMLEEERQKVDEELRRLKEAQKKK
jgi:TonB family protein